MFACEGINREDYIEVINKKINTKEFSFIDYEVAPLSKKSGIFGEHYIMRLNITRNGKKDVLRYFLKTLPQVESQRDFTLEMGAFFKEEQMFKVFIPMFNELGVNLMSSCAPKCYLSQPNKMLIFEDLSAKGFRCLNPRDSYTLALVKLTIKTMVKLHASGIIAEERMSSDLVKWRLRDEHPEEFQEMLYCQKPPSLALISSCVKGTATQVDAFPDEGFAFEEGAFKRFAMGSVADLTQHVLPSEKYRNVICHGDLWAANIMFRFEGDVPVDCLLVDFQSYRYCPPAQDLLTFIYLSTDRRFRAQHMDEIIDYYYTEFKAVLEEHGVIAEEVLTRDEFLQSCEDAKLFAVVQSVTHFQVVMMSPEGMAEFLSDPEYNKRSMFEDRSENILKMCAKDEFYKNKQRESITDLRELYQRKYL